MTKISSDVLTVYKLIMELESWEAKELLQDLKCALKNNRAKDTTVNLMNALSKILDEEDD